MKASVPRRDPAFLGAVRAFQLLALFCILSGCTENITVLTSDGLTARQGTRDGVKTRGGPPAYAHLLASYKNASKIQQEISEGKAKPNTTVAQDAFRQMVIDGFSLADANCSDYFRNEGRRQQWILFGRDVIGAVGTLATAATAAAGSPIGLIAGFSIATATGYNGLDVYQRNFLFGAENIDSVRLLIQKASVARREAVLSNKDPWQDFGEAQLAILQYQEECMPATILSNTREAIKGADASAIKSPLPDNKQVTIVINAPTAAVAGGQPNGLLGQPSQNRNTVPGPLPNKPLGLVISRRRQVLINFIKEVANTDSKSGVDISNSELRKIAKAIQAPYADNIADQRSKIIAWIASSIQGSDKEMKKTLDTFSTELDAAGIHQDF